MQAAEAQASLCICTDSPEPPLLGITVSNKTFVLAHLFIPMHLPDRKTITPFVVSVGTGRMFELMSTLAERL